MPHGHCYFWQPGVLWSNVVGDALTVLSYYTIPFSLLYFADKRKDYRFNKILLLFGTFILLCGTTHLVAIFTIWIPAYRLEGLVKVLTGLVSTLTAVYLILIIPKALKIPSPTQLQEANEEMASFSYSVAHDLRSPIRHIQGFATILQEKTGGKLSEQEQTFLQNITSIAAETGTRIDEMLKYLQLEKQDIQTTEVDVDQLVRNIMTHYDTLRSAEKSPILWEIDQLPPCWADPAMMTTVFQNLIDNAVKFTSKVDQPRITIRGKVKERFVEYEIKDNGVGFDMQFQAKLFQPFTRLHNEPYPGYGIGLANVHGIIRRKGGKIHAKGKLGKGAIFTIQFPLNNQSV